MGRLKAMMVLGRERRSRWIVLLALLVSLLPISVGSPLASTAPAAQIERPNVILIVTDDQDVASLEYMPNTRALLRDQGVSFSNFIVAAPVCCPSRASMLRGQYPHSHGVLGNVPPNGGFETFNALGREESTIATWLDEAGYQTGLVGKYMNGYGKNPAHVPPGWDEWFASAGQGRYDSYRVSDNGHAVIYDEMPADYETDVFARRAVEFITAAAGTPFFLYLAPHAPHAPAIPAPRDADAFAGTTAPRPPSFNEDDVADKPDWIRATPGLTAEQIAEIDLQNRNRLASLLAVDQMVADIVDTLVETGQLDATYLFFTSDNGFLQGEHRRATGKNAPYEEVIRVPLLIRGPGIAANRIEERLASNIDLGPTFAELAGVPILDFVDGRSLVPLLTDSGDAPWRQAVLVEMIGNADEEEEEDEDEEIAFTSTNAFRSRVFPPSPAILSPPGTDDAAWTSGSIPAYRAMRTNDALYVEYLNGERELYNLRVDPYQLDNLFTAAEPAWLSQLSERLAVLSECRAAGCRAAEDAPIPPLFLRDRPTPVILSPTSDQRVAVGDVLTLSGGATDAAGAALPAEALQWDVVFYLGNRGFPLVDGAHGGEISLIVPPPPSLATAAQGRLAVYLTATEVSGGRRTVGREIMPHLVDLRFQTEPPGLSLRSGGFTFPDGTVLHAWAGQTVDLDVPAQTDAQGEGHACIDWADGAPCTRSLVVPAMSTTYTATFAAAPVASFPPIADAAVRSTRPTRNSGRANSLYVAVDGRLTAESYLRFDTQPLTGEIARATLWLYATEVSAEQIGVYAVGTDWEESSITWETRPPRGTEALARAGPAMSGTWIAIDVTAAVANSGNVDVVIATTGNGRVRFTSKEAANNQPILVIETR